MDFGGFLTKTASNEKNKLLPFSGFMDKLKKLRYSGTNFKSTAVVKTEFF